MSKILVPISAFFRETLWAFGMVLLVTALFLLWASEASRAK
jgi:hypothetical protein